MKNKSLKSAAAVFAAAALTFLPSCYNGGEINETNVESSTEADIETAEIEKSPVSIVRDTFNEEIEALKAGKIDNISFENLKTFSFPDVNEITTYKVAYVDRGNGLSSEQFFENFVAYCEYLAPSKFSKDEISEKCNLQGDFENPEEGYYNYNQFKEINKDGSLMISYISLETPDFYLAYFGQEAPYWYNGGAVKSRDKVDSQLSPIFFSMINDSHPIVYYTENMNSTDIYHLTDGDISIADASQKANELLADITKLCDDGGIGTIEVCAVSVVDIGDGCYGYSFTITPVVDGINYSFADMRSDSGSLGTSYFSTENGGCGIGDYAQMMESGDICAFTKLINWKEKTAVEVYDSIVPLKTAAENVSKLLSGEMDFKAKSVTLVYDTKDNGEDLLPCWRFVLENSNPEKYYHVYVNAITGEARVKGIQKITSGYEYD